MADVYDYPFMQIVEDVMLEMREASTESHVEAKYKRIVNNVARFDIAAEREWDWLRKTSSIVLAARYNTGTLTATNASATVTGSGTTWTSAAHDGMKIKISGSDQIYTFTYVSATGGTISPTYYGSTSAGLGYTLYQDKYSLPADFLKYGSTEPEIWYYVNGTRHYLDPMTDKYFRRRYTYQPSTHPRWWRFYPGRTTLGRRQIEITPPAVAAQQLETEYIKMLPEMYEVTGTTHAATACTTTKVYTVADLAANVSAGQYISGDPTTFGGAREWARVTAVGTSTITDGITVETLRTAMSKGDSITICDAPDMIPTLQKAIFYGACAIVAADMSDPALKAYLMSYEKALKIDKSRMSRMLYGRRGMELGNWR